MIYALLALAIFAASAAIDYANAKYVLAVGERQRHRAARWSVAQWAAGLFGFIVAVKFTLWLLPAEALGMYVGTFISVKPTGERGG